MHNSHEVLLNELGVFTHCSVVAWLLPVKKGDREVDLACCCTAPKVTNQIDARDF